MTKKRSICLFILFTIILVISLVACFVNFTYPLTINSNYFTYSNFISNLRLGQDISNSLRITYRTQSPEDGNYNQLLNSTIDDLTQILQSAGYTDVTISTYGEDAIVMNVANLLSKENSDDIINLVGNPASISFSLTTNPDEAIITRQDIDTVEATDYYDTTVGEHLYYVSIKFKDSKKDYIAEQTKNGGNIYIFFGNEQFTTMDMGTTGIENGYIYINSDLFTSKQVATNYANRIKTGMLPLELTKLDSAIITPTYGVGANLFLLIAMCVLLLVGFVYLIVKYNHFGLLACFNLLFYVVFGLFFLQSIPLVNINFAGIVAMALAFIIAMETLNTIIKSAKAHYNNEAKLPVAFKLSYKENLFNVLMSNILFALVGLICLFMPVLSVKSFGWVMFVLSLLNMFTSLVLMRLFTKMYLGINSQDGKKLNFHKGGKNA